MRPQINNPMMNLKALEKQEQHFLRRSRWEEIIKIKILIVLLKVYQPVKPRMWLASTVSTSSLCPQTFVNIVSYFSHCHCDQVSDQNDLKKRYCGSRFPRVLSTSLDPMHLDRTHGDRSVWWKRLFTSSEVESRKHALLGAIQPHCEPGFAFGMIK